MRSVLEKALTYLLNEEHEKAEELFHQFIIDRARQIHESLRQGEDKILDENWDQEIAENYFAEDDLEDVTDDDGLGADDGMGGDAMAGGDMGDGMAGDDAAGAELGDDMGADGMDAGLGAEGSTEERIAELEQSLQELQTQFDEIMGTEEGAPGLDDGSMGDDMGGGDMTGAGDMPGGEGDDMMGGDASDNLNAVDDEMEDETFNPMNNAPMGNRMSMESEEGDEDGEELEEEDEFDDITESIVNELEKVSVTMHNAGGREFNGRTISQNNTSPIPQKKVGDRVGAEPVEIHSDQHEGYDRESSPNVKDVRFYSKVRNTKRHAEEGQKGISKEGDKNALINDLSSEDGNKRSPIGSKGSVGNVPGIR